jgi:hypothetical protein
MLHNRTVALAAILLTASTAIFAQNSQGILPYDDPAFSLLSSIYLEQGKVPLSTAAPFSAGELAEMLSKVDAQALSPAGKRAYTAVQSTIEPKITDSPMQLRAAVHPEASVEGYLNSNTDPAQTIWEAGSFDRLPLFAFPVEAWIGDNAYAAVDLALRQNHDGSNASLVPSNYANWTLNFDLFDMNIPGRAFTALGGPHWSFSTGRDRLSWGSGQTGNLLISDAPDFHDFARLTLYWPSFSYTSLWILLYSNLDNYRAPLWGSSGGNTTANNNFPRNLFMHRLDFTLFDRVSISLNEGILVGGVQPDLVYFNPLMIFHDLFRWGHASSIFSVEATYNPWRYFELYGQAAYNQIQTPYELFRYGTAAAETPNASSYLGGIRARVPLGEGYIDAGAEAVFIGPWMYLRENVLTSYEWWRWMNSNVAGSGQWVSAPIGYETGPDALVFAVWAGYEVPTLYAFTADFKRTMKGQQTFATTYAEDAAAIALMTPTGIAETRNVVHLGGSGDPFPWLRLAADLYWISVENFKNVLGAQMTDFQATLSATVHTDL